MITYFKPSTKPYRMVWSKITAGSISTKRFDTEDKARAALKKRQAVGHVGFVDYESYAPKSSKDDREHIATLIAIANTRRR